MAKAGPRSAETRNVAGNSGSGSQPISTHPVTRTIDAARTGQSGSVKGATIPVPSIADAESRRQKGQSPSVPVNLNTIGAATTEAEQRSLQQPLDAAARVKTEH